MALKRDKGIHFSFPFPTGLHTNVHLLINREIPVNRARIHHGCHRGSQCAECVCFCLVFGVVYVFKALPLFGVRLQLIMVFQFLLQQINKKQTMLTRI